jgi:hypothetical protein
VRRERGAGFGRLRMDGAVAERGRHQRDRADDASIVEAAFRERMRALEPETFPTTPASSDALVAIAETAVQLEEKGSTNQLKSTAARLSVQATAVKLHRMRDRDHRRFICR